ncbi:MAG: hypothetical protein GY786_03205 [Proteobacteria bacterium]|nr:hypothetical protein [Pseudomonadota bacterium]
MVYIQLFSASIVFGQILLDYGPKFPAFPDILLSAERTIFPKMEVEDSSGLDIGESSVEITDKEYEFNLKYFFLYRKVKLMEYHGFESPSNPQNDIVTSSNYMITKGDLPGELVHDSYFAVIPIEFDIDKISLIYGKIYSTDREEISEEDEIDVIAINYSWNFSKSSVWSLGWYQAEGFGSSFNSPILGYHGENSSATKFELIPSTKWMFGFSFFEGDLTIEMGQEKKGSVFRLTDAAPWENSIISFSGLRSYAKIGFHIGLGFHGKLIYGQVAEQKIEFYDDEFSISSDYTNAINFYSTGNPEFDLSLKDYDYYGLAISLSI